MIIPSILQKKMKQEKIANMRGFLCRSAGGEVFFRQHNADHSFRDFDIAHYDLDLEIEIVDSDAYSYQKGQTWVIHYGPNPLGRKHGAERAGNE
jgi:hypothetical protein